MANETLFRSHRLTGRPPDASAAALYTALFGDMGAGLLQADLQDWTLHNLAPWTLAHAGHDVGVGGFRLGFGDNGLELIFHFLPDAWGQGLASEFVRGALDHAQLVLRESEFFANVDKGNLPSLRILEKVGFIEAGRDERLCQMRLSAPYPSNCICQTI